MTISKEDEPGSKLNREEFSSPVKE
jgi:hypothetical protein